jgi:soluble lytic murein transglycosylase
LPCFIGAAAIIPGFASWHERCFAPSAPRGTGPGAARWIGFMRNLPLATSVALVLSSCRVAEVDCREAAALCDGGCRSSPSGEIAELRLQLAERDAELARLRRALRSRDDQAHFELARAIGIADAVKASELPERQQRRLAIAIVREAELNGVDPLLVVAVIRIESSFDNYAVSRMGARGLMQVMPDTADWLLERRGGKLGRRTNLFDPELNIELGTAYLAELMERFGSLDRALAAYNAGPDAARRILADTAARARFMQGYPRKVLSELHKLRRSAQARLAEQVKAPAHDGRG